MTDCSRGDMRDLLPDLLHDRLDVTARAEVERHAASCPACAAELDVLRSAQRVLARVPVVDAARIARAISAARTTRSDRPIWWRPLAGAGALAAGVAAVMLANAGRSPERVAVQPTPTLVETVATSTPGLGPADSAVRVPPARDPGRPRPSGTQVAMGLSFGGGLSDLGDRDLEILLAEAGALDAVPETEPGPALDPVPEPEP